MLLETVSVSEMHASTLEQGYVVWSGEGCQADILLPVMAPHSSTLAWKIPWTEEPGGLQSMGSLRVGHD